jgi:cytochrome c oxidase subunit 4
MSAAERETSATGLLATLIALLLLAGVSLALRYAHLGTLGYALALGIAVVKASLVGVFFMEILAEKASARFAIAAGLVLMGLLLTLTLADILTRAPEPLAEPASADRQTHG